jgi:hypothetical protein
LSSPDSNIIPFRRPGASLARPHQRAGTWEDLTPEEGEMIIEELEAFLAESDTTKDRNSD